MPVAVKVGTFAKPTTGAPAVQQITGFGFAPQAGHFALILWTSGGIADNTFRTQAAGDNRACIGIASGTAAAEQFAASTTADTAGGGGRRITQKAFLLTDAAGVTVTAEGSVTSLDSDGVTITWTTNNSEAQIIHYLAIGGADVQAKVIHFESPGGVGNFSITGAGFPPNLLVSTGSVTAGTLDTGLGSVVLRVGAGISSTSRWAATMFTTNAALGPGWRWHRNNRFVQQVTATGASGSEMDIVSLDPDGFTLNNISGGAARVGVLCLRAPNVAVGTFTKPTGAGPATGQISSVGFPAAAVLLASDQDVNRANASSQTGARMSISAFSASAAESSVLSIPDNPAAVPFASIEKTSKATVKVDNATPVIDAEATGSITGDGFVLTWNTNDAVATEYGYVAIGDVAPTPAALAADILGFATIWGNLGVSAALAASVTVTATVAGVLSVNPLGLIINSTAIPVQERRSSSAAPRYLADPAVTNKAAQRN